MTGSPEFSRRIPLSEIGAAPRARTVEADSAERDALARRFGLAALASLKARADISAKAAGIEVAGRLQAEATQSCVVTGAPLAVAIDEPFRILFAPPGQAGDGEEIELSADECDIIEHDGLAIDLGEAVAQSLALARDPFPRAAGAEDVLARAGVVREGEEAVGPFAALKALRPQSR